MPGTPILALQALAIRDWNARYEQGSEIPVDAYQTAGIYESLAVVSVSGTGEGSDRMVYSGMKLIQHGLESWENLVFPMYPTGLTGKK